MDSFSADLLNFDWQAFHFIRPEWLYGILPLIIVAVLLKKLEAKKSGWQGIVASHLYQHMVISKDKKASTPPFTLLALCWTLACIALAGPTWQKLPQPVYQVNTGKVVIMDMSLSMRSTDVKPDRLTRARFKVIDLLNSIEDGEIGLVVYAGDAFTVSPLTSDVSNITALVPSLRPEIMPVSGSYPIAAFEEAKRLLSSAGYTKGEIYWLTDGIDFGEVNELRELIAQSDYQVSILGVGTDSGAPIKQVDGSLLKDNRGNIVIPKLESRYLRQLSGSPNVRYTGLTVDDSDVQSMKLESMLLDQEQVEDEILGEGDQWQDMGAFVVLLFLPLAAYAFRRGILALILGVVMIQPNQPAFAQEQNQQSLTQTINPAPFANEFFQTKNQLGKRAFEQGDFAAAAELFEDPMWQGAAHYEQGNFEAALEQFQKAEGLEAQYNQANALAKLGDLQSALELYEDVLSKNSDHENALQNKEIVEELLEQQQQQQQQDQQNSEQGDGEQQDGEQDQNDSSQNSDQGEQQQSDQQQNGDQDNSEQQNAEQDQNSENQSDQQNDQQGEQDNEQSAEQEQQDEQQGQQEGSQEENGEESTGMSQAQQSEEELTPEQLEQLQRDRVLLNKVPDDPAFLLQRKMLLESQQRKRERVPSANKKEW
jgi:Ca-activated chloride channel family protein